MSDEICRCGHHRRDHIYEEGACRPGFPCEDDCNAFKSATSPEDDLLADLAAAEEANTNTRPCQVCVVLTSVSEPVRAALEAGLAGTIGRDKLVTILTRRGFTVGRRAVERHRQEGHTP